MTYNNQCKTCNLTGTESNYVDDAILKGEGNKTISRNLFEKFNVKISRESIRNHRANHVGQPSKRVSIPLKTNIAEPVQGFELNEDGSGVAQTGCIDPNLIGSMDDILRIVGLDPDVFEVTSKARISSWSNTKSDRDPDEPDTFKSYRVEFREKLPEVPEDEKLDLLVSKAKSFDASSVLNPSASSDRTLCVVLGDAQTGKVGSRGNTTDLMTRINYVLARLETVIDKANCSSAVLLDAGDIIEGFENTPQQSYTNDLSIMEQVDLAHTIELMFIEMLSKRHEAVDVMSIPSNHAAWRNGKSYLGKPSDDWGIHIARRIQKELDKYVPDHNVNFHYSDVWRKSLNLDVQGYGLGLVHGDDVNRPDAIENWWMKQVHGAGPTALSDFLVHGHFHTFRANTSGRSIRSQAQKWILGAPTLDNGSDWYANGPGGSDSDPGLLTFVIEKDTGLTDLNLIVAK